MNASAPGSSNGMRPPDEIVGYHLEQAHRYRKELEPSDPAVVGLAKRAQVACWLRPGLVREASGCGWRPTSSVVLRLCSPLDEPKGRDRLRARHDPGPARRRGRRRRRVRLRQSTKPTPPPTTCLRRGRKSSSPAHDYTGTATREARRSGASRDPALRRKRKRARPRPLVACARVCPRLASRDGARTGSTPLSALFPCTADLGGPPPAACRRSGRRSTTVPRDADALRGVRALARRRGRRIVRAGPTSSHSSPVSTPTTGAPKRPFASSMTRTTSIATSRTTGWPIRAAGSALASTCSRRTMSRRGRSFEAAARRLSGSAMPPRA